jgi:RHS repeat-associated protein
MKISLNVLSKIISLIGVLFFTTMLNAQVQEKEYSDFTPTAITSFGSAPITIYDSEASNPNQIGILNYCYLSLNINNNEAPFVAYELKATFTITPLKQDGTSDIPFEKQLVVNYNPNPSNSGGANFSDLSYLKIENRFGIKVQLKTYQALNISGNIVVPNNAIVNMGFKSKRYYAISEQLLNPIATPNTMSSAIVINWGSLAGALEYELEWTWLDSYSDAGITTNLAANEIPLTERDFELNNTRIITSKNTYEIPLIYGKGYLIYRIRGIGRNTEFVKYYGNWSSGTSPKTTIANWPHQSAISEHEADKNWQFQASYAEDGKKKEVVSYFDGSLRNRQTVTKINTDNTTVVGEVIYDGQGRAGIEVLPTPTTDQNIHFFKNFNLNSQNKSYSYRDFDLDGGNCSSIISAMSDTSGSSKYYSPSGFSDFSARTNQAYVPDSQLYPFSQIEYTPDNTGRIARKGGVGITHQLGKTHEMKYYYTTPNEKELHRLFGYAVGEVTHYKKNIVVDPNGQVSVSYLDPQGRTIATALAGGKPDNLVGLAEESVGDIIKANGEVTNNGHGEIQLDLLNKKGVDDFDTALDNNVLETTGAFSLNEDKLLLSKQVIVAGNNILHNFDYNLNQTTSFVSGECTSAIYPFVYDIKLSLKDDCGTEKLNTAIQTTLPTMSLDPKGKYNVVNTTANLTHNATATLNTGTYSLTKEIIVNKKALNDYADNYIERLKKSTDVCYVDPNDPIYGLSPNAQFIANSCDLTCETCNTGIGTRTDYVQSAFDKLYGNGLVSITASNNPLNATTNALLLVAGSVNLEGNLIMQSDIDGLNIRFNREWELLYSECERICNPTLIEFDATCQINENLLLSDLKPNGQYGATDDTVTVIDANGNAVPVSNPNFDKLSVFNTDGKLFFNGTDSNHNWKHPINPYALDGKESLLPVEVIDRTTTPFTCNPKVTSNPILSSAKNPDGSDIWQIKPEQLEDVNDFIANWNDSWAESLLPYHPEYKYLEYSQKICNRTKSFAIPKYKGTILDNTNNVELSSEGYDSYLMSLSYDEAKAKNFIDLISADGKLLIYNNDPYFSSAIDTNVLEDATLFNARYGTYSIMHQALSSNYVGNLTLYQLALQGVLCNSFSKCDLSKSFSDLSSADKEEVWKTYRALYISLKSKIDYIFINIYAMKAKAYNGCIGTGGSATVTDVLTDNFSQKNILAAFIKNISASGSLCESSSATLYQTKQKNYLPSDFGYNSSIDPAVAADNLVKAAHFEYYAQTGNCPLLYDLDMLLNGFFKDKITFPSPSSLNNVAFNKQYLSKALMEKLMVPTGNQTVAGLFAAGLEPLNIATTVSGTTLNINFNPTIGGGFTTCPIEIELPATGGYTWSNYGSSWNIKNIKQLYYDVSNSRPAIGEYKYSMVAQIGAVGNDAISDEILLTGQTCAPIGECGIASTSIGEILDPNIATSDQGLGCNKKAKFEKAFLTFLNELKRKGDFFSATPVNLSSYTSYTNSYLAETFGSDPTTTWEAAVMSPLSSCVFYLKKGTVVVAQFSIPSDLYLSENSSIFMNPLLDYTFDTFNSVLISENTTGSDKFQLYISGGNTPVGQKVFANGTIVTPDINFDCCPVITGNTTPIPEAITSCSSFAQEELTYENNLKDVINQIIAAGNANGTILNCSDNPTMMRFINESELIQHFQALRDVEKNSQGPTTSIELSKYSLYLTRNTLDLYFYNNNNSVDGYISINYEENPDINIVKTISYIDLYEGISLKIGFTDINEKQVNIYNAELRIIVNNAIFSLCSLLSDFSLNRIRNPSKNTTPSTQCSTCIPQTVLPVACDDKKAIFISQMANKNIPDYTISEATLADFCDNGYQYISDSYLYYLQKLQVSQLYDIRFRTITEFGDTYLHYGFNGINAVIDQYKTYYDGNLVNGQVKPDTLNWNDWVETVFRPANIGKICPPVVLNSTVTPELPEETVSTCQKLVKNLSEAFSAENYNNWLQAKRQEFIANYIKQGMSTVKENLGMTYSDQEYQYTLYYYDQAGNLTQTVPPEGVKRFSPTEITAKNSSIEYYKQSHSPLAVNSTEDSTLLPNHSMKTQYKYNSLNQLVWQQTPDGGITKFAYDALGRIIASQNAKQLNSTLEPGLQRFSYTTYDHLGRISEAGEIHVPLTSNYTISEEGKLLSTQLILNEFSSTFAKTEVTHTIYTDDPEVEAGVKASSLFTTNTALGFNPASNNRNRVTGVFYYETYNNAALLNFNNAILYNYDVHGNVKEIVNYSTFLKSLGCTTPNCEIHLKRVVYDYDLISGNVNSVTLQPNKPDQFIHKYEYDADNRIVNVQTSTDGVLWEKDANYQYYAHGPLARVELGDKKVQGIDYAYTLQGWLKTVNGENISDPNNDMGQDGLQAGDRKTKDAFGYSLSYFDEDYKAISGDNTTTSFKPLMYSRSATDGNPKNLYNGNIKQMTTAIRKQQEELMSVQKNNYTYDQLNRIKAMTSSAIDPLTSGFTPSYQSSYSYDRNGNLQTLRRTAPKTDGTLAEMDLLQYDYQAGNNKLALVKDNTTTPSDTFDNDLENQLTQLADIGITYNINNPETHNYIYDEIGQLIEDKSESLKIDWRVDGKVKRVTKIKGGNTITYTFQYDGLGNRIAKTESSNFGLTLNPISKTTYYVRDAQGNELAVYTINQTSTAKSLVLKEHDIYGSNRLGTEESNLPIYNYEANASASRIAQNTTANTTVLSGVPVVRMYSLNLETTTPAATWPMQAGSSPSVDLALSSLTLDTRIKLVRNTAANGEYLIGKLQYNGTQTESNFINTDVSVAGVANSCIVVQSDINGGVNITKLDSPSCPTGTTVPSIQLLAANEDGYLQSKIAGLTIVNNVETGFKINGLFYGFKTIKTVQSPYTYYKLYYSNGSIGTTVNDLIFLTTFAANDALKIEKTGSVLKYYWNNSLINTVAINPADIVYSQLSLGSAAVGKISNLKVVKNVPNTINKEITNQVQITLVKNNTGFRPKVVVAQYTKITSNSNVTATKKTYQIELHPQYTPIADSTANGISLNLNTTFGTTPSVFNINGSALNILETPWTTDVAIDPATIPTAANNQLGGAIGTSPKAIGFNMCYFNYGINNISNSFTFDDATSQAITSNTPVSTSGIAMDNTTVTRTIETTCLPDTDGDGVYDLYEVNNDLSFIDTDGDGLPNHNDPDDDGDGILTQHEAPGNGVTLARNTNGVAAATNPKMRVDSIPDYLDADDDGDGYATWETVEGGPGVLNTTNPGNPYTLNSDSNNIPNYLDYSDVIYPVTGLMVLKNYVNLVGDKRYELSNHLGNVLVVVSDKKIPNGTGIFNADVLSYSDYYPFGMLVPNKHGTSRDYRFGFNGKENDNEVMGEGNFEDYGMRSYNPRIGRFFSVDPLTKLYPELTPYQFASNSPISGVDLDGLEYYYAADGKFIGKVGESIAVMILNSDAIEKDVIIQINTAIKNETPSESFSKTAVNFSTDLGIDYSTLVKKSSIVYAESSHSSDKEAFGIASVHKNHPNKEAYGEGSANAKAFIKKDDEKRNGTFMQTSISGVINAENGGIDYSNGADSWDGIEQGQVDGQECKDYYTTSKGVKSCESHAATLGWTMSKSLYDKFKVAVEKVKGKDSFKAPQHSRAWNYDRGKAHYRNQNLMRYEATAVEGGTVFWKTRNGKKAEKQTKN